MENIFVNGYHKRVTETGSVLCPRIALPERIPFSYEYPKTRNHFQGARDYLYAFIDGISDIVPAVEFQKASYSAFGKKGEILLGQLISRAQSNHLCTILDVNSGNTETGESIEDIFDRYGVDACTFAYTPDFFSCKDWLETGHMPIFLGPKIEPGQGSEVLELELCQYNARMALGWNNELVKDCRFAGVGCFVRAKAAKRCREIAGGDIFFLICGEGPDYGVDEVVDGLLGSHEQIMGAVTGLEFTMSWWDKEINKPHEGKTLELVRSAIKTVNNNFATIIRRKLGKQQKGG